MIDRLLGILLVKQPPRLCLDVRGVGYDIERHFQRFTA